MTTTLTISDEANEKFEQVQENENFTPTKKELADKAAELLVNEMIDNE